MLYRTSRAVVAYGVVGREEGGGEVLEVKWRPRLPAHPSLYIPILNLLAKSMVTSGPTQAHSLLIG